MNILKHTFKAILLVGVISLSTSCNNCPDTIPSEHYNEPANIIPIQQAKEMYNEYSLNKVPALMGDQASDGTEFNPTRYIEYDIDDIRHYLDYIENESKRANVDIASLRIYFGAYPNADAFETGGSIKYPRQETIFITPTAIEKGERLAYFTRSDKVGGKRYPVFTKDLGDELMEIKGFGNRSFNKANMLAFLTVQDTTDDRSLIMNRGNVIPPPKKDDDFSSGNGED